MAHRGDPSGSPFLTVAKCYRGAYVRAMGTLTTAELEAQIVEIEEALALARTAYKQALTGDHKSYRLDSAGGSQRVDRRNTKDLRIEIRALESELEYWKRRLSGRGNPGLTLRRRW